MSNTFESFLGKALRHLRAGDVGPDTIARGLSVLRDYVNSSDVLSHELSAPRLTHNYVDIKGMTLRTYELINKRGEIKRADPIYIVEFPHGSRLEVFVTPHTSRVHTDSFLLGVPNAIAEFTGPTFDEDYLPNNGFFFRNTPATKIRFQDTNPPGSRRGAIAIRNNGELELVDDRRKWEIIRSNYVGYDALSGTSMYLKNGDTLESDSVLSGTDRSKVSYLIQYTDQDGSTRLAYLNIPHFVPRFFSKMCIDTFTDQVWARSWFAVELEYLGARCVMVNGNKNASIGKGGTEGRLDHYVIVNRQQNSGSATSLIQRFKSRW